MNSPVYRSTDVNANGPFGKVYLKGICRPSGAPGKWENPHYINKLNIIQEQSFYSSNPRWQTVRITTSKF